MPPNMFSFQRLLVLLVPLLLPTTIVLFSFWGCQSVLTVRRWTPLVTEKMNYLEELNSRAASARRWSSGQAD